MAQLIALIHVSAKFKVQPAESNIACNQRKSNQLVIGKMYVKFNRQDKQAGKTNNKYTVNCIFVTTSSRSSSGQVQGEFKFELSPHLGKE